MKITIDYTLHIKGEELQPTFTDQNSRIDKSKDLITTIYRYKDFYITVYFFLDTRDDRFNAIVCKDKEAFDSHLIDGEKVITTNFNLTYEEMCKEIEIAIGMIDGTISFPDWLPDSSVNKALFY